MPVQLEPEAQLAKAKIQKQQRQREKAQQIIAEWEALPAKEREYYTVEYQRALSKLKERLPAEYQEEVRAGAPTKPAYLIQVVKPPPQQPPTPPPETEKLSPLEQQIIDIYKQAPIVEQRDIYSRSTAKKQYYAPTPEQQEQIISLAMQLPPEKRKKYVTYEPVKEAPKGLGEFLAGISIQKPLAQFTSAITGTPVERIMQIQEMEKKVMPPSLRPVEPVKEVGGWVASVEAPVYTVGRLLGLETPRPPPTVSGGLIGKGVGAVTGQPSYELEQALAYGPEYARGTILGDIAVSLALGWAAGKAWSGLKKIPVVKKAPLATERFGTRIIEKLPPKLKKLFYKTELEVQRRYDPRAQYAMKQARYRPHYTLTSDLGKFMRGTQVQTGVAYTPFSTTLAKTVEIPTKTGQVLLQKTTQEVAKQLPTLTLVKTVTPVVKAVAPKVVAVSVSPTILGKMVSPFLWAGAKYPSIMKTDIWSKAGVKVKPYPVVALPSIKPYPKTITDPSLVSTPRIDSSAMVDEIMSPQTSPVVSPEVVSKVVPTLAITPVVEQAQEIVQVPKQIQQQIQRQQLRQIQIQRQRLIKQQMQVPDWLMPRRRQKRKKKKRGKPLDFYGRYKRFYPVATAKEFLEMMF